MFQYQKLELLREQTGLSQDDLVYQLRLAGLDIVRQTWVNWTNGKGTPDANALPVICKVLKTPMPLFFKK